MFGSLLLNGVKVPALWRSAGGRPAAEESIIWWAKNGVLTGTTNDVNDIAQEPQLDAAEYVGNNCLEFASGNVIATGVDNSDIVRLGIFEISFHAKRTIQATQNIISSGGSGPYGLDLLTSNRTRVLLKNDSGVVYTPGQIITLSVDTTEWHFYQYIGDGSGIDVSVDGNFEARITFDGSFDGTSYTGSTSIGTNFDGRISGLGITCGTSCDINIPMSEGSGVPYDISGNGNHAISNTATWTTDDDAIPHNITNGFRIAVQQTAPYIPAMSIAYTVWNNNEVWNNSETWNNTVEV